MIYFDSAATSLYRPPEVRAAVSAAIQKYAGYGRSGHQAAAAAAETVYACRAAAAKLFGMDKPENVIFCSNATHALNTAICGYAKKNGTTVISCFEHNSVWRPACACGRVLTAEFEPYNRESALAAFDSRLGPGISLCTATMVSNVFGNILPVAEIGAICRKRGIPFVVDASQAAGFLDINAAALNADAICMPGHKGLLGPTGTGLLLLASERLPAPLLYGGTGMLSESSDMPDSLPERYEAGTLNVCGICGLLEGIRFISENRDGIYRHESALCSAMAEMLGNIPGVRVFFGPEETHCRTLLSFTSESRGSEELAQKLSEEGFAVRAGLHCAPLAHKRMGTSEGGTVRVSFCYANTLFQAEKFADAVRRLTA